MGPGELARVLGALPVVVADVRCHFREVPVPDYGGAGRPSTRVELSGRGEIGHGELVAFSAEEHHAFAGAVREALPAGSGRVADLVHPRASPHARAALEGALIDLALRQAGLSLGGLSGQRQAGLRWVSSFAARADPVADVGQVAGELKLDVSPDWDDRVIAALGGLGDRVRVFDFKEGGSPDLAARLSAAFGNAIFEDPPPGCRHPLVARDRPLLSADDVRRASDRGEIVNLKAPRMGGYLELLRGLEHALAGGRSDRAYFGGMFEVGPGREQARQLAALLLPDAPNDLAPFAGGGSSLEGPSPSMLRLDRAGFGSNLPWPWPAP